MLLKKRLSFTLIEILIVFSIIAGIAGVIGINIQKAFRDQSFKTEVASFVNHLRLAQDLMLITDSDIHFKIEANSSEKVIKYWIETDKTYPKNFDTFIKKVGFLKTVNHISHQSGKDGLIDLNFVSKGSCISSGNIQLSSVIRNDTSTALIANVSLKGYPSPIYWADKIKIEEVIDYKNFDLELTQVTVQEIQAINNERNKTNSSK